MCMFKCSLAHTCICVHVCMCDIFISSDDIWVNAHITQDVYIVFPCVWLHVWMYDIFSSDDIWVNVHITQIVYIVFPWVWASQGSCWVYLSLDFLQLNRRMTGGISVTYTCIYMYAYLYTNSATTETDSPGHYQICRNPK